MAEKYLAYPEYKNTDSEWVSEIPVHWEPILFKRVIIQIKDGTHGTHARVSEGFPFLSAKNVLHKGVEISDSESMVSEKDYKEITANGFPKKGDLLITCVGTIGRTCVYEFDKPYAFQRSVAFLRLSDLAEPKFYKYFVESKNYQSQLEANSKASAQSGVYMGDLVSTSTVLLPKDEQKSIANFLDYQTAQIDTLIEKQQTLIQLLKEKRQAVISHAVTKGLNPNAPMKDSGVEWLGEVPEHWTIPQIGYHSKVTKLTGFEYTNLWHPNIEGKIIALRGFNIQERYLDLSKTERITEELSNKLARSKLYEGDIVLPCTGTLGNAALIQENDLYHINQNIAKVTINSELFNTGFTVFWMTSLPFRQMIDFNNTSGMQPVLLIGDIRKLPIPLLPLDEQQEIVDFLLLKTEHFDRLINNAEQAIQLMQERRTALISAAVTGKIDVRGWQASN